MRRTKELGQARALAGGARLSFREKLGRLGERLKESEWRNYAQLIIVGKLLGLVVVGAIIFGLPHLPDMLLGGSNAVAQDAAATATAPAEATPPDPYAAVKPVDYINAINTGWVLLGAFLVFGMQAGFTMLEAGFCRNRETVNVLVECVFDTCVCGLLHWGIGFAFMFGEGNPWIGWHMPGDPTKSLIFMSGVSVLSTYGSTRHSDCRSLCVSVCVCGLCLDDLLGCDGRPDAFPRRRAVFDRRLWFDLSDFWTLVLGSGWFPGDDG